MLAKSGNVARTLTGHTGEIAGICVTPDGKLLVSAGGDKTVGLWNYSTGDALRRFADHKKAITAVAVSFNGNYAAAGEDGTAIVWG